MTGHLHVCHLQRPTYVYDDRLFFFKKYNEFKGEMK